MALQTERKVADLSAPDLDAATFSEVTEATTDVTVTRRMCGRRTTR